MSDDAAAPHISAVILDMDGLLIDTEPVWRASQTEVLGELGIQLSEADMLSTMGQRVVEVVAYWRRHRPWPGAASGEPSDVVIAGRIVDWTVAHVRARGEPMEGVDRAVALLRGLGLGVAIASSSSHRLIDAVCDRLGLEWIEIRCSADDELRGKLAGDVYLTAARAAGMRCIAVPDRFLTEDPRYREAQLILGSLDELDESRLRSVGWRRDS